MISDLDMDASLNKIKYTRHSWNLFLLTEGLDWLGGFLGCEDGPGGLELVVLVIVPRGYTVHWLDSSLDKVLGLGVNPFIGDCFRLWTQRLTKVWSHAPIKFKVNLITVYQFHLVYWRRLRGCTAFKNDCNLFNADLIFFSNNPTVKNLMYIVLKRTRSKQFDSIYK